MLSQLLILLSYCYLFLVWPAMSTMLETPATVCLQVVGFPNEMTISWCLGSHHYALATLNVLWNGWATHTTLINGMPGPWHRKKHLFKMITAWWLVISGTKAWSLWWLMVACWFQELWTQVLRLGIFSSGCEAIWNTTINSSYMHPSHYFIGTQVRWLPSCPDQRLSTIVRY